MTDEPFDFIQIGGLGIRCTPPFDTEADNRRLGQRAAAVMASFARDTSAAASGGSLDAEIAKRMRHVRDSRTDDEAAAALPLAQLFQVAGQDPVHGTHGGAGTSHRFVLSRPPPHFLAPQQCAAPRRLLSLLQASRFSRRAIPASLYLFLRRLVCAGQLELNWQLLALACLDDDTAAVAGAPSAFTAATGIGAGTPASLWLPAVATAARAFYGEKHRLCAAAAAGRAGGVRESDALRVLHADIRTQLRHESTHSMPVARDWWGAEHSSYFNPMQPVAVFPSAALEADATRLAQGPPAALVEAYLEPWERVGHVLGTPTTDSETVGASAPAATAPVRILFDRSARTPAEAAAREDTQVRDAVGARPAGRPTAEARVVVRRFPAIEEWMG